MIRRTSLYVSQCAPIAARSQSGGWRFAQDFLGSRGSNHRPRRNDSDESRSALAKGWIATWNAHDLDAILAHHDDAIELTSPAATQLLGTPDGKVTGKANLRPYCQRGLEDYPDSRFHLNERLCGVTGIVLYYRNQKGTKTAEFMEVNASGKVTRVAANYGIKRVGTGRATSSPKIRLGYPTTAIPICLLPFATDFLKDPSSSVSAQRAAPKSIAHDGIAVFFVECNLRHRK